MNPSERYAEARRHMVESQLLPNRVTTERLADAMRRIPRELFVPRSLRDVAYLDEDLEIAGGRYVMEPRVFARLLQVAAIGPGETVLDVGCATGYSAAVLACLAETVVALECDAELAARATALLGELEIDNVAVVEGELAAGLPEQGPYDVIVLGGSVPEIPDSLTAQIAEGGRLVGVVGKGHVGRAMTVRRIDGLLACHSEFDAAIPPLPGLTAPPVFRF